MSLHDFFSSYGSFLSGLLGAMIVVAGAILHIRQRQAEIATKVELCTQDRALQRDRIIRLEKSAVDQKREIIAYVDNVSKHVHDDMRQLKNDISARADRSDKLLFDQLASINSAIAELRALLVQAVANRRHTDEG